MLTMGKMLKFYAEYHPKSFKLHMLGLDNEPALLSVVRGFPSNSPSLTDEFAAAQQSSRL